MEEYTEYIKTAIIDTVKATTDKELLQLVYGILMNSTESIQVESPTT